MNQPVAPVKKRLDLRADMPETAKWVDARRLEWGQAHVDDCIKSAMKGVPGRFYAIEGGHVLGTPFPATDYRAMWQEYAVVNQCGAAFFMLKPGEMA